MNIAAYEAWIAYHHKRWKVTDVDLHVHWEIVNIIKTYFQNSKHCEGTNVRVFGHYVDKNTPQEKYGPAMIGLQFQIMQRTLENAKQNGNEYVMNFDPDEYLISNDFETIENMFISNETMSVTFPVFHMNYRLCSAVALEFGSLG